MDPSQGFLLPLEHQTLGRPTSASTLFYSKIKKEGANVYNILQYYNITYYIYILYNIIYIYIYILYHTHMYIMYILSHVFPQENHLLSL